jgi:hypothetical protein
VPVRNQASISTAPTATSRARIGGDDVCDHPRDAREYLGQMTTTAFFRCTACDGVIVEW